MVQQVISNEKVGTVFLRLQSCVSSTCMMIAINAASSFLGTCCMNACTNSEYTCGSQIHVTCSFDK